MGGGGGDGIGDGEERWEVILRRMQEINGNKGMFLGFAPKIMNGWELKDETLWEGQGEYWTSIVILRIDNKLRIIAIKTKVSCAISCQLH